MDTQEIKQREKQFKDFGKLLAQRHRQNYAVYQNKRKPAFDELSVCFGRYLRAARLNANVSPQDLAAQAGISAGTILALEQGLVCSENIKTKWLKRLAQALDEDVQDFKLILKRSVYTNKWSWRRLKNGWHSFNIRLSRLSMKPVYASLPAMLLCVLLSTLFLFRSNHHYLLSDSGESVGLNNITLIDIDPAERMNLVRAEINLTPETFILPDTLVNVAATERMNLIQAEKLRYFAPEIIDVNDGDVPNMSGIDFNFGSRLFRLPMLPDTSLEKRVNSSRAKLNLESGIVLSSVKLEGRPSRTSAEFNLENQILVLPKLINIKAADRLNMVKAEIRL